ncbi:MAG TPA: Uma2 family endonuclease [Chloroflexia bacterium]|nr:Uma2 family endonuclease [Chloroflexia bacterium]
MATPHHPPGQIYYSEEDGNVSESTKHYMQGTHLFEALHAFFAARPDVFVGGNLFVYYREGAPKECFSPDVMVALGLRPRPVEERGSYRTWEEGVPPTVIIELTSISTQRDDTVRKPHLYATLGVREYYLFDPLGEFLVPRLQGYHLDAQGQYERAPGNELDSPALGLRLVVRDGWLRLLDPTTGALLPTREEQQAALAAAEAEIARLRAELMRRQESP